LLKYGLHLRDESAILLLIVLILLIGQKLSNGVKAAIASHHLLDHPLRHPLALVINPTVQFNEVLAILFLQLIHQKFHRVSILGGGFCLAEEEYVRHEELKVEFGCMGGCAIDDSLNAIDDRGVVAVVVELDALGDAAHQLGDQEFMLPAEEFLHIGLDVPVEV
jgi:hypothetical protein